MRRQALYGKNALKRNQKFIETPWVVGTGGAQKCYMYEQLRGFTDPFQFTKRSPPDFHGVGPLPQLTPIINGHIESAPGGCMRSAHSGARATPSHTRTSSRGQLNVSKKIVDS